MADSYKRLKGFADIYGANGELFSRVEAVAREIFSRYDFEELRLPILEATELFQRSIGDQTDVVQKEMFTFPDKKGRSLTMRPEATAGVLRACAENGLVQPGTIARLFTIGPMFRYERPQKGRMRQFHQINCECLGSDSPYADADLICMMWRFLESLGLKSLALKINSLGCPNCRPAYLEALKKYFAQFPEGEWCDDCKARRQTNPLRVLDCKQPGCRQKTADAPRLLEYHCDACGSHFEQVLALLKDQNIPAAIDHHLVRGLDYYQKLAFEAVSDQIGAQTAVAGGGRYDGLLARLGGPDVGGAGFACGLERLALLLDALPAQVPDFYFLSLGDDLRPRAFHMVQTLRALGFSGEMNYESGGMKSLMRKAARSRARFCLILGPDEAARNEIVVRNMADGGQMVVAQAKLPEVAQEYIRNGNSHE